MAYQIGEMVAVNTGSGSSGPTVGLVIDIVDGQYVINTGIEIKYVADTSLLRPMTTHTSGTLSTTETGYVEGGGGLEVDQLDYPFTNEKGLAADKSIWMDLASQVSHSGTFVGVSGAIFDFAAKFPQHCEGIISLDINKKTLDPLILISRIVPFFETCLLTNGKKHFKTKQVIGGVIPVWDILAKCIDSWRARKYEPNVTLKEIGYYTVYLGLDGWHWINLLALLDKLSEYASGKINYSSWFRTPLGWVVLKEIVADKKFHLIWGNIVHPTTLSKLREFFHAKKMPLITLFNFSNVIDYIEKSQVEALLELFKFSSGIWCSESGSVIVTSTQSSDSDMIAAFGTFEHPKVLPLNTFCSHLQNEALQSKFNCCMLPHS